MKGEKMELPKLTPKIANEVDKESKREEERISKELGISGFDEIDRIIDSFKDKKKISISFIQREFSYGYIKSCKIFNYLMGKYIDENGRVIKEMICLHYGKEYVPGIKLIFLDVDGVLNSETTKDTIGKYIGIEDKKVSLLKEIVDASNAKIILVSTWNEYWQKEKRFKDMQDDLADYLDAKLAKQGLVISDKTDVYHSLDRGDSIRNYISKLASVGIDVESFVILDDEMFDYKQTKLTSNLVRTSYHNGGLQPKHVRKAIEKLC